MIFKKSRDEFLINIFITGSVEDPNQKSRIKSLFYNCVDSKQNILGRGS